MTKAVNINVDVPQTAGAPTISIAELKAKIQEYVNTLHVILVPADEKPVSGQHSLSSLRGICKAGISDEQAIDEYLADKY